MSYNQKPPGPGGSGMGGGPPNGPNNVQQAAQTFAAGIQQMQNFVHGQNALPQSSQPDLNAFLQQQRIQNMLKQQQFIHFQQMQQQQKQQQQHHNMTGGGVGGVVSGAGGGSGEPLALTRTPGAADLLHKTYQQQANGNPSANSPLNQLQQQLQQALHFQFQMHNHKLHQHQQQQQQHAQGGNQGQHHGQQQSNQGPLSSQQQQQQKHQQQQNPLSTVAGLQHLQQRYITAAQAVASGNKLSTVTPPPPPPPLTNQMKPPNLPPNTQITPVAGTTVGPNVPGSSVHPKALSSATMSAMGSGKRVAQTPPPSISLTPAKQNSPSPGAPQLQNKFQTASGTGASGKASIGSASPLSTSYGQNFQKHTPSNSSGAASSAASPPKVGTNVDAAGTALKSPQSTPVQLTKQTPPTTPTPPITTSSKTANNTTITNSAPTTAVTSSAPFATTLPSPQKSLSTPIPISSNSSDIKVNTKSTPLASVSTINDSKSIDKEACKIINNNGPETSVTGCSGSNKKDGNKGKNPLEKNIETSPKMSSTTPAVITDSEGANKNEIKTTSKKPEVDVIVKKPVPPTLEEESKLKMDEDVGDKKCNVQQDDVAVKTTLKDNAEMIKTSQTDPILKNDDTCKTPPKVPSSAVVSEKPTEEQKRSKDLSIADRADFEDDVETKNDEKLSDNEAQKTENPKTNISIIKEEVKPISNTAVDTELISSPVSRSSEKANYLSAQSSQQDIPTVDTISTSPTSIKPTKFAEKKSVLPSPDKGNSLEDRVNDIKLETNNIEQEESKKILKAQEFSNESIKVGTSGKTNKNIDGKEANNTTIKNENTAASTTTVSETVSNATNKKLGRQNKSSKANKATISAAITTTSTTIATTTTSTTTTSTTTTNISTNEKVTDQAEDNKPIATGRAKRKSKVESYAIDSSTSATPKVENITPSADRKSQRHRLKTILYQSPLPELAYITKLSASEASNSPKPMSSEDRLIVFYKNEYMAVRNAEGTFYLCQTMQNVYRTSPRISIRWLSEDSKDPNIYVPDFYDHTDIECVLTTVELKRIDKGHMRLPKSEKTRIESILKKALDVEKGIAPRPELTEENPDGLDISLYKDESQIEKKSSLSAAAGNSNVGHETPLTTGGRKSRRGVIANVVPKSTTTSSHNTAETSASSTIKGSKRKRSAGGVSLLTVSTSMRKSSNKKRKTLKRKRKQKSISSDDDDDQESSDDLESDTDYKPNQKRSTFNASASKATPRAQRSPLAKARAASPITPTTSRAKNVPQESTRTPSTSKIAAATTTRGERASKRKAADALAEESIIVKKSTVSSSTAGSTPMVITAAATTSTTPTAIANTKSAATTNNNKNKSSESASSIESSVNSGFTLQKKISDNKIVDTSVTSTNNTSVTSTNNNNNNNNSNSSTPLLIVPNASNSPNISTSSPQTENTGTTTTTTGNNSGNNGGSGGSSGGNRSTRSRK
uniref:Uncharacterized protein n=1 Tax=Glossina brevipalpis TaxID=37001 RepID=A0A1A9WNG1_9MUSC